ncbi:MAG: aminotransferase class V-fold PLP-dependent enzyme [Candidatus Marinimicrobia bacterium]|nr:aminotransferase class V-fold PLP-dependent enzyme [Candidatus Neomarinimicrobiota bacterium]
MDPVKFLSTKMNWVPPGLMTILEKLLRKIPRVQQMMEAEYDKVLTDFEDSLNPYRDVFPINKRIPPEGREHSDVLTELKAMKTREAARWQDGFASGAVYHGDAQHINFLNQVYALHSQSNPLHADLWPSTTKFEAEIVSMTANMLGAEIAVQNSALGLGTEICGTVTSGGTESILLAMKTYRDWARDQKGIRRPNMVVPETVHAAFDKAAQYFKIKKISVPVDSSYRVDLSALKQAVNRNTIVVVGSTPSFPHGAIDPIPEISEFAWQRGIGCHVDACLGGFVLPWARKLGYDVPDIDFRLRGVTSISADTHKYGYAAKGTSVVLYRGEKLRHYQYYTIGDWPGGLYLSPTFAGSRPGALSAACWAAMLAMGEAGYLESTRAILETAQLIKTGIQAIPDLKIMGDPLWVIAFASSTLNIFRIMDEMAASGWSLNGLHRPNAIHLAVTLRHTKPGVAERFLADLESAVATVRSNPSDTGKMAPVYGMAATMPFQGIISDILKRYLDALYKVD